MNPAPPDGPRAAEATRAASAATTPAAADAARAASTRRTLLMGAACAGAVALAGGIVVSRRHADPPRDGSAVLALKLPDMDGREQSLAQWQGKVLVVNFWATWCAPCREEMPHFVSLQRRDGAKGLQFVGIAVDDADKVRQFAKEIGLNYPALIGGYGAIELSKTLGNELSALPFTLVLDRAARIVFTQLGPLSQSRLEGVIRPLLEPA